MSSRRGDGAVGMGTWAGVMVLAIGAVATAIAAISRKVSENKIKNRHTNLLEKRSQEEKTFSTCPICKTVIEDPEGTQLPCTHVFHTECLGAIFKEEVKNKRICPFCREYVDDSIASSIISATNFL